MNLRVIVDIVDDIITKGLLLLYYVVFIVLTLIVLFLYGSYRPSCFFSFQRGDMGMIFGFSKGQAVYIMEAFELDMCSETRFRSLYSDTE